MRAGDPRRLGAHVAEGGTDFAIWAPGADAVEISLFDGAGETRFALAHREGPIWHGHLVGVGAGTNYGYRIYGPWQPDRGARFNPAKLLLDPYSHLIEGEVDLVPEIYGHHAVDRLGNGLVEKRDDRDSAPYVPRSVVTNSRARKIDRPNTPWNQTVIYEAHLRGFTFRNTAIPPELRGTYAALGDPSVIEYLKQLGVTALELLPIHHFVTEVALRSRGRSNHWGYNPLAFSAPHRGYAATNDPITELQSAVDSLHHAGIEVILDVVYNHTAEEGITGPTFNFRGIDNRAFYRQTENGQYQDLTGCGNTFDTRNPFVTRLVIDSLHWWSEVIGVDGFRFDLGTAISRRERDIDTSGPLFAAISADPVLRERKLIVEPWDIAGYALGGFQHPFREWNDSYRDSVRRFWLSDSAQQVSSGVAQLASRLAGSNDIFYDRGPTSSINFITAHDGFTLADLVSYQSKHNEPNLEGNRDGAELNHSWNVGVEGKCEDELVNSIRLRLQRSLLATLFLSAGIPLLRMGDEISLSQAGSNNAYSLDNSKPWDAPENFAGGWALDWNAPRDDLFTAISALAALRAKYLLFDDFFTGALDRATNRKDLAWFNQDGMEMSSQTWQDVSLRQLALYFDANHRQGIYAILNSGFAPIEVTLPNRTWGETFRKIYDSAIVVADLHPKLATASEQIQVEPHTLQIWLANQARN